MGGWEWLIAAAIIVIGIPTLIIVLIVRAVRASKHP